MTDKAKELGKYVEKYVVLCYCVQYKQGSVGFTDETGIYGPYETKSDAEEASPKLQAHFEARERSSQRERSSRRMVVKEETIVEIVALNSIVSGPDISYRVREHFSSCRSRDNED